MITLLFFFTGRKVKARRETHNVQFHVFPWLRVLNWGESVPVSLRDGPTSCCAHSFKLGTYLVQKLQAQLGYGHVSSVSPHGVRVSSDLISAGLSENDLWSEKHGLTSEGEIKRGKTPCSQPAQWVMNRGLLVAPTYAYGTVRIAYASNQIRLIRSFASISTLSLPGPHISPNRKVAQGTLQSQQKYFVHSLCSHYVLRRSCSELPTPTL